MENEELSLTDLVDIPTGDLTEEEKDKYDGTRTKIASASVRKKMTKFQNNKELPDGRTVEVQVVLVETAPIGTNVLGQPIMVKEEFMLKKHPVTGKWGVSLHEKSKSKKLFNKLKVNSFPESIGKEVVVIKKVSEKNPNRTWLGLSI